MTAEAQGVRGDGFLGCQAGEQEKKLRSFRHHRSSTQGPESSTPSDEKEADDAQSRHKDALVQMVANQRCSDALRARGSTEAAERAMQRLKIDQEALREALQQLNGPRWELSGEMDLRGDRRWVTTRLRPLLRDRALSRVERLLAEEQGRALDIVIQGIPADNEAQAVHLLASAGLTVIRERGDPPVFQIHTKRGTAMRATTLRVRVAANDALRHIWCGRQRVGGAEVICERLGVGQEENEDGSCTAVLKPPHAYASEMLQQWCRAWGLLGLSDLEMREMIIWSTQESLPEWRIDELLTWSPGSPRPLRQVWAGTGATQGQIRLRGARIAAQHRNAHLLRNVHAIGGQEAFDARGQNCGHHLPRGAERQQRREQIQIGLPDSDALGRTPTWGQAGRLSATWEPMIPGSDWEAASTVCIRFKQTRALTGESDESATRRQVRQRLVSMLNEIQHVCRLNNKPFEDSDVCYAAMTSVNGSVEGIIALQKRDRTLLEDDTLVGAVLGFYIGNEVRAPTTSKHKWCPISGRLGETACGVSSITAAYTFGGLTRRQIRMGTQRAGEPTWRIWNPKEGTVRRILALVGGRGDKTALLARLRTTPWTRKKTVMARVGPTETGVNNATAETGNRACSPPTPSADNNAKTEPEVRRRWFDMLKNWEKEWVGSLVRRTVDVGHQQPGGPGMSLASRCRSKKAAWLGLCGDRAGARAVTGDWTARIGVEREMAERPRQVGSNLTKPAAMWAGFRNFVTTATRSIHGPPAQAGGP